MIIDTTTAATPAAEATRDDSGGELEDAASSEHAPQPGTSCSTWKQEVVSVSPLVGKLLQPEFDQANFLYNMYKSCTVGEIEDFKLSLQDIREGTVVGASRDCVTTKSNEIAQLVKDMI